MTMIGSVLLKALESGDRKALELAVKQSGAAKGINGKVAEFDNGRNMLQMASSIGNVKYVEMLLSLGADANVFDNTNGFVKSNSKESPFCLAVTNGHVDVARILLESCEFLTSKSLALNIACGNNNIPMIKLLLSYGACPNNSCAMISRPSGGTAFHVLCELGYIEALEAVLDFGHLDENATEEVVDDDGMVDGTAVDSTEAKIGLPATTVQQNQDENGNKCAKKNISSVEAEVSVLNAASDKLQTASTTLTPPKKKIAPVFSPVVPNFGAKNFNGDTALKVACAMGHLPIVSYLIECHESELPADFMVECVEAVAVGVGSCDTLKYLLDIAIEDIPYAFLGKNACKNGHFEIVRYLCENRLIKLENSHLTLACAGGSLELVHYIMSQMLSPTSLKAALMIACDHGRLPLVEYLLGLDSTLIQQHHTGSSISHSLLLRVVSSGHLELTTFLLNKEKFPYVDINFPCGFFRTRPLDKACALGNEALVKLLLHHGASVTVNDTMESTEVDSLKENDVIPTLLEGEAVPELLKVPIIRQDNMDGQDNMTTLTCVCTSADGTSAISLLDFFANKTDIGTNKGIFGKQSSKDGKGVVTLLSAVCNNPNFSDEHCAKMINILASHGALDDFDGSYKQTELCLQTVALRGLPIATEMLLSVKEFRQLYTRTLVLKCLARTCARFTLTIGADRVKRRDLLLVIESLAVSPFLAEDEEFNLWQWIKNKETVSGCLSSFHRRMFMMFLCGYGVLKVADAVPVMPTDPAEKKRLRSNDDESDAADGDGGVGHAVDPTQAENTNPSASGKSASSNAGSFARTTTGESMNAEVTDLKKSVLFQCLGLEGVSQMIHKYL